MKKLTLILLLVILVLCMVGCNKSESTMEKEIKNLALYDLGIDADTPSDLVFISSEKVKWSDFDYYVYELTVNGHKYRVGVNRTVNLIHYVDVEKEII